MLDAAAVPAMREAGVMTDRRNRTPFAYSVYRFATWVVWCLAWVGLYAARMKGAEWRERLGDVPEALTGAVWVHAASVGEIGAALPLVRELAAHGQRVCVTVVTPAGVRIARATLPEEIPVSFAPLDFVPATRRVLRTMRPSLIILVENELWPNLLHEARAHGVPVAMANARMSERSLSRYRSTGSPLRDVARLVRAAVCQSEEDVARFVRLGFERSRVRSFGSTKFDSLARPLSAPERAKLRRSFGFDESDRVFVFGSVRPMEEAEVARAVAACLADLDAARAIVAPRHLKRAESVVASLERSGVPSVRRTGFTRIQNDNAGGHEVVVLDTTGELGAVYAIADAAFVGGTLADYGGHNPLEPAAQGVPVVLGPHTETCRESAGLLLDAEAAVMVSNGEELAEKLLAIVQDAGLRRSMSKAAFRVMEEGRGASARAVEWLHELGLLPTTGRGGAAS